MERFITHYVWHQPDQINPQTEQALKLRMQNRLNEMTDRRRRLIKYIFKKESRLQDFEKEYPETIDKKKDVTGKFGALQLEELLNNSTKNVAQEVVTCLIPNKGEGVLCILEMQNKRLKWYSKLCIIFQIIKTDFVQIFHCLSGRFQTVNFSCVAAMQAFQIFLLLVMVLVSYVKFVCHVT